MRNHPRISILVCLFVLTLITISNTASAQQVRIVHINVGQGDATFIVGPSKTLLFDGGVTGSGTEIRNVLDSLSITSLDYFVAGHYHADHIGAIDEVINGGIALNLACYDRGGTYSSQTFTDYLNAVGARRTTITLNQQIDLGGGCVLTCIAVNGMTNHGNVSLTDENDRSIALVLRYGTFDYLITSDFRRGRLHRGCRVEDRRGYWRRRRAPCGHHGSSTTN